MQTTLDASTLRIVFAGDILSTNVAALRTELLVTLGAHPEAKHVAADLTNSRTVDSQGINLLLALYRETERRQVGFRVENPSAEIRRLFDLLNLSGRFGLNPARRP